MSCSCDKQTVVNLLQQVKETITKPPGSYKSWVLIPRPENIDCMTELGFKFQDVRDVILGLSVEQYSEGPLFDKDIAGELWVFGKFLESKEVYIKLKLATSGSLKKVRVISFHFANAFMHYPFKNK